MEKEDFKIETLYPNTIIGYSGQPDDFVLNPSIWEMARFRRLYGEAYADWSGFYLAETQGHAGNYSGNGKAIYKVILNRRVTKLTCTNDLMGGGTQTGKEKADLIKEAIKKLGMDIESEPLMAWLGSKNVIFSCQENELKQYEIIVPDYMVKSGAIFLTKMQLNDYSASSV
ncbi:hypothetical protein EKP24_21960 [Salmonella enterica]|nr:hypothetical protein [Salmonella enterica]EAR3518359.1 hypothetical protein [Salmonella enterica]